MSAHKRIKNGMRRNEVEVLSYLRRHNGWRVLFGHAWSNALNRLMDAGRVVYRKGQYMPRKGAGPVTGAAR